MRTVALLTAPGASAQNIRKALRMLRLRETSAPHDADGVIIAGAPAFATGLLLKNAPPGVPVLCQPSPHVPRQVTAATHLRFIPGALLVRQMLQAGSLGTDLRFIVQAGSAAMDQTGTLACWDKASVGGGVLLDAGAKVLDLLSWWFGPLSVKEASHDGLGGVESELLGTFRASHGKGSMLLSRLRDIPGRIVVRNEEGDILVDLAKLAISTTIPSLRAELLSTQPVAESALQQRRIVAWMDGTSAEASMLADTGTRELLHRIYQVSQRLRHVWEPEGSPGFAAMRGRRVLVTGATGFIGSRLTERLVESGADVVAAIRSPEKAARIARLGVHMICADLSDVDAVRAAVHDREIVFSLAHDFDSSGREFMASFRVLADSCRDARVSRIVHASSIATFDGWPGADLDEDSPTTPTGHPYKRAKIAIDSELRSRSMKGDFTVAIMKPTIVYGPFSRFWTDNVAERMRSGTTALPESFEGLCNGVHVDDVVDSMLAAALSHIPTSETYIVSGPEPFPWRQLFEGYASALDSRLISEPGPSPTPPAATSRNGAATRWIRPAPLIQPALRLAQVLARTLLGKSQIDNLRTLVQRFLLRRNTIYRPIDSNPSLFLSKGQCSVQKLRRRLYSPRVTPLIGLRLTQAYLHWRFSSSPWCERATDAKPTSADFSS